MHRPRFRVIKNLLCCNESSNPVEQKSHDVINNKLSRVMKEVAEESMKMAAVEEYSSSPDNFNDDDETEEETPNLSEKIQTNKQNGGSCQITAKGSDEFKAST
ncbi:hypothetical protein TNCV_2812211 [Trichonephila clavipes]|nr:hypothetical protein TNCV_2812211 [Trichonephila clavipes]